MPTIQKNDPLLLEIIYSMMFTNAAKRRIREVKEFVNYVKNLHEFDKREVSKIARDTIWKIEGEENKDKHYQQKKL